MGRVGRRRPGIAYISNEVDADYSSLDDRALNQNALAYEPIRFPLATAPLLSLAYYASCQPDRADIGEWLKALDLPSKIHENQERMTYFDEQVKQLETLGITKNGTATELGKRMSSWIGRADIAYATQLQRRLSEKAWYGEVLFWLVATALSNTSIASLRAQYSYFSDYGNVHSTAPHRMDIWKEPVSEDLAVFHAIAEISQLAPRYLWFKPSRNELAEFSFYKWCNWVGLNDRKVLKAAQAITDAFKVFEKANKDSPEFKEIFGENCLFEPFAMEWMNIYYHLPVDDIVHQLLTLPSMTTVRVSYNEDMNAYTWETADESHSGIINQDDTPLRLLDGRKYMAQLIPSRANKGDEITWRLRSIVRPC